MTKMVTMMRMAVVALLLAFGAVAAAPAVAQDDEGTPIVGQVGNQAEEVVEDDDDGFEWGLLGLLGLLGLAGLFRRPQPVVHDDLNRSHTTTTGRDVTRRDDETTI